MCGRYTLTLKRRLFDHEELDKVAIHRKGFTPRYNIAPGLNSTVIRLEDGVRHGTCSPLTLGLWPAKLESLQSNHRNGWGWSS